MKETRGRNPMLPLTAFIPDGEPHVFEYEGKKRLFIYGSRDERITAYCGMGHDVWSAPVCDLTDWSCHGEAFHVRQVFDIGYGKVTNQHFGAPDCVYNPITKKYYLYTFLGAEYQFSEIGGPSCPEDRVPGYGSLGPKCVMASGDSPAGPFSEPVMCDWPAANRAGAFDPTVLVDEQEDGSVRVYAYWGMYHAGIFGDRCAELDPADMHTIINPATKKPDRNAWRKTLPEPEQLQGSSLFEASSIKKVSPGHYVFIYSANECRSALTYCYSESPMGTWKYGGQIICNHKGWNGGNNHGSIVKVESEWYVVYHRKTTNDFNRQAMIEPIRVYIEGEKVIIPEVPMTSQGVETCGLNAFQRYPAGIICCRTGHVFIDGAQRCPDGLNPVEGIDSRDAGIGVKYLNFGESALTDSDGLRFLMNVLILADVRVTIQVAKKGTEDRPENRITLTEFQLKDYGREEEGYRDIIVPIRGLDTNGELEKMGGLKGVMCFFLKIEAKNGEACRIKEFEFK